MGWWDIVWIGEMLGELGNVGWIGRMLVWMQRCWVG